MSEILLVYGGIFVFMVYYRHLYTRPRCDRKHFFSNQYFVGAHRVDCVSDAITAAAISDLLYHRRRDRWADVF